MGDGDSSGPCVRAFIVTINTDRCVDQSEASIEIRRPIRGWHWTQYTGRVKAVSVGNKLSE